MSLESGLLDTIFFISKQMLQLNWLLGYLIWLNKDSNQC